MLRKLFREEKSSVFCLKLAIFALFVRFCFSTAYYHIFVEALKRPLYAFDGEAYSIMGWYIALVLKGLNVFILPAIYVPNDYSIIGGLFGTIVNFEGLLPSMGRYGVGLYSYIIGWFYFLFGYAPVLLRFFMGGISVLTAFITYRIASRVFDEQVGRISFAIALFMPSFVLYSSSLQRDTLINLATILVISQILRIRKTENAKELIMAAVWIFVGLMFLYFLRINAMLVLIAFLLLYLFIRFAYSYRWVAFTFAGALLACQPVSDKLLTFIRTKLALMLNYHLGLSYLGGFTFRLLPDSYYSYANLGKAMSPDAISIPQLFTGYLNAMYVFLFEPSLFAFHKAGQAIVMPQMLAWYAVLVFAAAGVCTCFKKMTIERLSLIMVAVLFSSTIGLSEANYETLLRHRDMIVPVFIIFAAYGMVKISDFKDRGKVK
jgi:4-amino-4-deoxy-L-arabinose transferase-like glycosyltransferase